MSLFAFKEGEGKLYPPILYNGESDWNKQPYITSALITTINVVVKML
jgi:hypothetical protein